MPLRYDASDGTLHVDGRVEALTGREGDLLDYLLARPGQVVTRRELEREVWGFRAGVRSEVVPVTVRRLRKKLGADRLETIRGRGWRLRAEDGPEPLPEAPPPPPGPAARPPASHGFFGREDTLEALLALLHTGRRLVTLHGPGGVGKTRLAQELVACFEGEVCFCDLATTRNLDDAVSAVADALDAPLQGSGSPLDSLRRLVTSVPPRLYVLDNLEQLGREAPVLVEALLETPAPRAFLATSRDRLGLRGERVFPIEPLPTADAAALFRYRVEERGMRPQGDERDVERLVAMLDGLPLAIELAAARATLLTPASMIDRLSQRFRWLVDPRRAGRQSTLEACLDWSWDLLDPAEAAVLTQLSVFAGPFSLEDAEAVAMDPSGGWIPDRLQALVDQSMVQTAAPGRFRLLVSVRALAGARLTESGRESECRARHARWFARFGTRTQVIDMMRQRALSADHGVVLARPELLEAAERLGGDAPSELVVDLGRALWMVVRELGPIASGARSLEKLLQHPLEVRGRATLLACLLEAQRLGTAREAVLSEALAMVEALDPARDPLVRAALLDQIARALLQEARHTEAEDLLRQALALYEAAGVDTGRAAVLVQLGKARYAAGHPLDTEALLLEALELAKRTGHHRSQAAAMEWLGRVCFLAHRWDDARQWLRRANRHSEGGSDVITLVRLALLEGDLECRAGQDLEKAEAAYRRAIELAESIGSSLATSAHGGLGIAYARQSRPEEAARCMRTAIAASKRYGRAGYVIWLSNLGLLGGLYDLGFAGAPLLREALTVSSGGMAGLSLRLQLATVVALEGPPGALAGIAEEIEELLQSFGEGGVAPYQSRIQSVHARVALERGEPDAARDLLEAVPDAERDSDWHLLSAQVALRAGDLARVRAEREAVAAKVTQPRHPLSRQWAAFDALDAALRAP